MVFDLLGIAKFLESKNLRDGLRDLYRLATRSPEWRMGVVKFEAKIRQRDKEYAKTFGQTIRTKMVEAGFHRHETTHFLAAYYELVDNGFVHGCVRDSDSITIRTILFGDRAATVEVINNNRGRRIPPIDELQSAEPVGVTGRGLKLVLSLADQVGVTHGGRGLKIVCYKHDSPLPVEAGITFIRVGGFSGDVAAKINRSLKAAESSVTHEDIILLFEREVITSAGARAAAQVEGNEFVKRFAIVTSDESMQFLADLQPTLMPKLIGCFVSVEEAVAAMRVSPDSAPAPAARLPPAAGKGRRRKSPIG